MKIEKILASSFAKLNSNVHTGGGDDDTAAIQAVLDRAADENIGIHLVMDGAALVSHLKVHSNTTIECLTKDCGFYQIGGSDTSIVTNYGSDRYTLHTRNITLIGGTYNQNCREQAHHTDAGWTFGVEFYGVENLLVRDVTIAEFRTFAFTVGGFRNVMIENVWFDMKHHMNGNQDGFHFWGPGQYLTVRNSGGYVSDDIMNIGPDELDSKSSITDVLVDGLYLDDAEQAVRLLSRGTGRLDRVTIRNVTGQYRSFGFYVNPWFCERSWGNFGHITIENVDLKEHPNTYKYREPVLFAVGGNIEHLTLRNIRHHNGHDARTLFELCHPFGNDHENEIAPDSIAHGQRVQTIEIDGLTITENENDPVGRDYIEIHDRIENFILKNVFVSKNQSEKNGTLISFKEMGEVDRFVCESVYTKGLCCLCDDPDRIAERLVPKMI